MSGGEGCPSINPDQRAHRNADRTERNNYELECEDNMNENDDDDDKTFTVKKNKDEATIIRERMNPASEEGLRRRKVIHAAKETFDKASRLLRRKIPCTGHLMTPRRLWIKKVPTQECDVVMMFPSGASDETLMWLLGRLRTGSPGLVVHVRHHTSSDSYSFYLTAPFNTLLKAAEEFHLPKEVRQEFGGGLKEFVGSEASCYEKSDDEARFFTTQERQSLVIHLLHSLRAGSHDINNLPGVKMVEGQAVIPKCLSAGIISQVFPLHELPALEELQKTWVRAFFNPQPLDDVCKYFGVKISMYFAWLGHYTTALIIPAAVGVIYWVGIIGKNQAVEDGAYVLFSVLNVIWATVYLEMWKRKGAELAYRWGTLDQRDDFLVEPRPLFWGTLEISQVTGRLEPTYPMWRRNLFRYLVSSPIIAICLFIVFIIMILSFQIQDWWDARLETKGFGFWLSYVPKVSLAIVIAIMDEAYYKIAVWLNDLENYRLDTEYENHLIYKVALFQFVNSFLSLFYIAFYLQDQERLKEQLAALLIARQIIGNLKDSAVPYIVEQLRLAKMSFEMFGALSPSEARLPPGQEEDDKTESAINDAEETGNKTEPGKTKQQRNVSQAELESSLYKYDGAFSEHLEMLSQLGYVCLFSSAFPLAAMAAFLGNIFELRGDAFKLCFVLQRPFGRRVSNIGTWQNAMEAMGFIAILVNCALIGLSGQVHRMFPEMSTTQTILLIVALEHIMLAIRFIIIRAIPDIPHWLATEMAKVEFLRREAVRRLSSTPSPEQQPSTVIGRFLVSNTDDNENKNSMDEETTKDTATFSDSLDTSSHSIDVGSIPKITEMSIEGETSSHQENNETSQGDSSRNNNFGNARDSHNFPRCSIPGGERGRRSKDWLTSAPETPSGTDYYNHHLTIGPHGGIDWVRRLGLDPSARKSSDSKIRPPGAITGSGDELALHRSTDCIVSKELASSSDSDLLRSASPWLKTPPGSQKCNLTPKKEKPTQVQPIQPQQQEKHNKQQQQQQQQRLLHQYMPLKEIRDYKDLHSPSSHLPPPEREKEPIELSDSSKTLSTLSTLSNQEEEKTIKEEREAKKMRVKQSLMKRARSVAIFSLKLKERRAREGEIKQKEAEKPPPVKWQPPQSGIGGELSCIPIEKLISVDDIAAMEMRKTNH